MARGSKGGSDGLKLLAGLGFVYLLYKATGLRGQNSPFIPDAIEDQIDRAIGLLDRSFGKEWVDHGLNAVEQLVRANFDAVAPGLAQVIYSAEEVGRQLQLSGWEKKQRAVRQLS